METALPTSSTTRQPAPPSKPARTRPLALATLCLAVLIVQLDTSVVNLAVHPIDADLHAGVGALQWVVDGYNLTYATLLLTGGLLADLYGRRLMFMIGAAVFTAASLFCAFAPTIGVLIGGRAVAGVGAALLLPASLAIIRVLWTDPAARGRALGIWAGCNGLALAIGPSLGGFLINWFGWRSIFIVVVPVGIAALLLAIVSIPETSDPQDRHFDASAQILAILALGSVTFAAIQSHGSTSGALTATTLVVAALALTLFLKLEARRGGSALVPLDMFKAKEFVSAIAATAAMTFGMYGALFLVPFTWQAAGRLGPVGAGIALMPMALVFVLVSSFSGMLTERLGRPLTIGGGVAIIGSGLLTIAFSADAHSLAPAEIGLALTGLGMGLATGPLMGAAVGAVAAARSGTAAALINVARMVGATIGVAALGALFAFADGGPEGLRIAMLTGGAIQLLGAATAWATIMPRARGGPDIGRPY